MGVGIEVYNADGTLQFSSENRLFRTLTNSDASAAGSVTVSGATSQGTVIAATTPMDDTDDTPAPTVIVSGNTASWTGGARSNVNLMAY